MGHLVKLLFILLLWPWVNPLAQAQQTYVSDTNKGIFQEPSSSSKRLGTLKKGVKILKTEEFGGWMPVRLKSGAMGYVEVDEEIDESLDEDFDAPKKPSTLGIGLYAVNYSQSSRTLKDNDGATTEIGELRGTAFYPVIYYEKSLFERWAYRLGGGYRKIYLVGNVKPQAIVTATTSSVQIEQDFLMGSLFVKHKPFVKLPLWAALGVEGDLCLSSSVVIDNQSTPSNDKPLFIYGGFEVGYDLMLSRFIISPGLKGGMIFNSKPNISALEVFMNAAVKL